MSTATATIRELRTDFRSVKRKIQHHGQVIITDNGVPSYELRPLPRQPKKLPPLPDYMARLRTWRLLNSPMLIRAHCRAFIFTTRRNQRAWLAGVLNDSASWPKRPA